MPRKRNKKLSFLTKDNLAYGLVNFLFDLTTGKKKKPEFFSQFENIERLTSDMGTEPAEDAGFFVEKISENGNQFDWLARWGELQRGVSFKKRILFTAVFSFLIVIVIFGYVLVGSANDSNGVVAGAFEENVGAVKGEKITASSTLLAAADNVQMASQNFAIRQIHFGGDLAVISTSEATSALAVMDVKSEVMVSRNRGKEENKLVISWKTNKLAESSIQYGKNGDANTITVKEDSYAFNHSVIISGLAQGTPYSYSIAVKDKWGNQNEPGHYATYSGSKTVSVFELIAKTLADIFGWAGANK